MSIRLQVITTGPAGAPYYNTFYSTGVGSGGASTLASNVEDLFTTLAPALSNTADVDFDGVVEEFNPVNGQTVGTLGVSSWHVDGSWGTGVAPGGTCLLLRFRTGSYANGREIRGRSFISGLGDFAAGIAGVPGSQVTLANAAAVAYATATNTAVYSPTQGLMYGISLGSVWNKFGLMRSRRD